MVRIEKSFKQGNNMLKPLSRKIILKLVWGYSGRSFRSLLELPRVRKSERLCGDDENM